MRGTSGETSLTTKELRVRTSMYVEFTTLAFTYPRPNPRCGTTVHAFHGLYR
jgi:hypothetical protein